MAHSTVISRIFFLNFNIIDGATESSSSPIRTNSSVSSKSAPSSPPNPIFFPFPAYRPGVKNACWEVSQTLLEKRKGSGAMAERKRAIQLKFYVTEQERILIEEKMKLLQTDNLGAYLRKMAIDGYIMGR